MNAVAIGDGRRLAGYALAGVVVRDAVAAADALAAFDDVGANAALLVLTAEARSMLASRLAECEDLPWVVLPE